MNLVRLRFSMVWTLTIILGLSTLFIAVILSFIEMLNIFTLISFVLIFNIVQWLIAPYLIDFFYRVKEAPKSDKPGLNSVIERLSEKSQISPPRVMIANIPIPNAFAYGSPLAGTRIAVTSGLLRVLEAEEVEAVIGHELGHIKHRDVQIMMFVSVLPAILYYISYSLFLSYRSRDRDRGSGLAAVGSIGMILYFVLTLLSLRFSRLREYYADRHSVSLIDDGARKLSEGLAKIVSYTGRMSVLGRGIKEFSNFKALFIADPETASKDSAELRSDQALVQEILSREPSTLDVFFEIFSTHPNIVKRLRALQEL